MSFAVICYINYYNYTNKLKKNTKVKSEKPDTELRNYIILKYIFD